MPSGESDRYAFCVFVFWKHLKLLFIKSSCCLDFSLQLSVISTSQYISKNGMNTKMHYTLAYWIFNYFYMHLFVYFVI
ncbi:hypothetical protein CW304_21130 [Bacillus sp. UFRGS-B20]|nr:hypothetical protein CW304_21130 [Bacillus sp. UFRGS-B20]